MLHKRSLFILLLLAFCFELHASPADSDPALDSLLKQAKMKKGYHPLFKEDLSNATFTSNLWEMKNGVLGINEEHAAKLNAGQKKKKGPKVMKDIWTKKRFGNFILDLKFKCEESTNSGVFVRTDDIVQWLHTGMEIQIMQNRSDENARHDTGAVYDCLAPRKHLIKEVGKWNHYTIICNDNWIHIILNGQSVTDMNLDLWTEPHKNPDGSKNKFNNAYKDMSRDGFVGLQYHGHPVWFRNMRIKELKK